MRRWLLIVPFGLVFVLFPISGSVLNISLQKPCTATDLVDDTFDGNILNRCKWDEVSQNGGPFTINGGEAVATTDPAFAFSLPRLSSQYRLTGDFDYQIDYRMGAGWSEPLPFQNSGVEVQIQVYWDESRYMQISHGRDAGGENIKSYTNIPGQMGTNTSVPASQLSGKFRAVRSGTTITLKYFDGTAWQNLTSAMGPDEPAYIIIGSIGANIDRAFTCYFDNFTLNNGPTSFHPFIRSSEFRKRSDFYVGGVVCDYMAHMNWGNNWQGVNPLDPLKQNGYKWVRVGVTTGSSQYLANTPYDQWSTLPWRDEYWSSREFAGQIMQQAQDRGYRLNLFLFLSNTAAHAGMQNAPPEWAGLTVAETAQRVDEYSYNITRYYMDRGLNIEVYDIGNEIDLGILNFRPGERIPAPPGVDITNDMTYMRENVWNIEAQLLQASINGIKRANPNAKTVLHAAGLNLGRSDIFVKTFFRTMVEDGVDFDYAGLSNPYNQPNWVVPNYTTDCWFQRLQDVIDYLGGLNKKVIFSEASYPHNPNGTVGPPMPEFPYTPTGQAAWAHEYLRFLSNQPNVLGFFWFYPDYHMGLNVDPALKGASMFQSPTQAMPVLSEFRVNLDRGPFDYDGDGKTDVSIFRPTTGVWYLQRSTAGLYGTEFGYGDDKITPADLDGDGKTDIAVYRPVTGIWYVLNSSSGTVSYFNFGIAEDLPTPADYDGDGIADISVFRPSTATWYRRNSSDGSFYAVQFGLPEDKPTIGDFDGDGKSDIAIFRPSDGAWYELYSSDNSLHGRQFGFGTDVITPADFDGDGKTDIAVFRPSDGLWYIANSSDGTVSYAVFGLADDIPAPGDFDGDGKADISVFRPSDGTWYRRNSSDGSFFAFQFGTNGDKPTQTAFRY